MRIAPFERTLRTGETLALRSPEAADAQAMLAYMRALGHEASRNLNHPPHVYDALTLEKEIAFVEESAKHPRGFLLAAFDGDKVAGTTSVHMTTSTYAAHCGELGLGVLAAYRRKGVGRLLMEALIEHATANGVWNLVLRVRTFNAPAIALYESLGFRLVGTLREVVELPEGLADEHVYQRIAG